ncbi:MAG: histidine phosphatase family protein [Fimbriimonadaceae bacterium]|nr:histidine phosphatase family protein [Fimbriimonadaceae bacterium]
MKVWIIRHGVTDWNTEGRGQGQADIDLSAQGKRQAELLAEGWRDEAPHRILSSDMMRTVGSAKPLSDRFGVPVELEPNLRERCLGDWEGRPIEEINSVIRENCPFNYCPPNGESLMDVVRRAKTILFPEVPTAYFSHGLTCGQLLSHFLGGDEIVGRGFRFDNTGVTTLEHWHGRWILVRHNCTRHLEELIAPSH